MDLLGIDLPASRSAGPHLTDGGRAAGFARDRFGAVLAAVHISSRTGAEVGPAVYRRTIAQQLTGPDVKALLAITDVDYERKRAAGGVPSGQPLGRAYGELIGYRVESYAGDRAVVRVLTRGPVVPGRPSTYDSRLTLLWINSDWRLMAPPGGDWSRVVVPAPATATGYTPLRKSP